MLLRKQPQELFCKLGSLEVFVDFTGEDMRRSLLLIEREAKTQVFCCGFHGLLGGAFFIEHLGATVYVT